MLKMHPFTEARTKRPHTRPHTAARFSLTPDAHPHRGAHHTRYAAPQPPAAPVLRPLPKHAPLPCAPARSPICTLPHNSTAPFAPCPKTALARTPAAPVLRPRLPRVSDRLAAVAAGPLRNTLLGPLLLLPSEANPAPPQPTPGALAAAAEAGASVHKQILEVRVPEGGGSKQLMGCEGCAGWSTACSVWAAHAQHAVWQGTF